MTQEHTIVFGPFRLEPPPGRLWRGDQLIPLRPRSVAMCRYLATHPGRLVSKAEVQQHVWAGTHVSPNVLRVCVREIRAALDDSAKAPRYLATVGRQGYRWLGDGDLEGLPPRPANLIVGRQGEVGLLVGWGQRAAHGARQFAFVSGEAGVGKTTVIEMGLARLAAGGGVQMVRGQCVEHTGEGEPYLPFMEAIGQLGQGPQRDQVRAVLGRYAPLWLAQLPGLASELELARLHGRLAGATRARMLRELAEALEALTVDQLLVLVLEDLQWSDPSTVEALAYLAQRSEPARLLVLGTYRPVDVLLQGHPLRAMVQELCGRGLGGAIAAPLARFVYTRTDGNALFMVNIVEHLAQQGAVVRRARQRTLREEAEAQVASLPEGLRGLLLRRIEALPPATRQVLEAASVVGETFAIAAVAAGVQGSVPEVEGVCAELAAQSHFLADAGWTVWPDATSGGQYRFQHALYQQVLYESLGTARRVQLHQHIGTRLEAAYGARAGEIAAQLAVHFERAGTVQRAVRYWQQTGENAGWRYAYPEALAALQRGLTLLATLPESPARQQDELMLQLSLGELLIVAKGAAVPQVGEAYTRACTLCQQIGESPQHFRALQGLQRFHVTQARLPAAGKLAQQLHQLARRQGEMGRVLESQAAIGAVALLRGDLVTGRVLLEPYLSLSDPLPPAATTFHGVRHLRVTYLAWMVQGLWELGYAVQAQQRHADLLHLAQQLEHPPNLVYAQLFGALLAQYCRNAATTYARADAVTAFATAQGLEHNVVVGRILLGWALAMQGDAAAGVTHIQVGLAVVQRTALKLYRPYFLTLLAEAYGRAGQPETGLTALAEALTLVEATEERWWEAEVYRLKGTLWLQLPNPDVSQAEGCFQQARAFACNQQAKALEPRAALSLSRLWQGQGKHAAARDLLASIYGWFTEGFDTPDLQEAKALLEELSVSRRRRSSRC